MINTKKVTTTVDEKFITDSAKLLTVNKDTNHFLSRYYQMGDNEKYHTLLSVMDTVDINDEFFSTTLSRYFRSDLFCIYKYNVAA